MDGSYSFVPKKSGEIRICVHCKALNKQLVQDFYPFPLPNKIQDRLTNATVFSTSIVGIGNSQ